LSSRPELDKALDYVRPGDQLVVTRLSRLGRSTKHLIELVGRLAALDVGLVVLNQGIDTSSPGGKLVFHLMASIAEFERDQPRHGSSTGAARSSGA
jgi:DNA invertase Pin-like site-specific DNA recombinase